MEKIRNEILSLIEQSKKMNAKDPDKSRIHALSAVNKAKENACKEVMGEAYLALLMADRVLSNYEEAVDCAREARTFFEMEDDRDGLMRLHNIIGILYYYNGLYELALDNFNRCYILAETLNNKELMMASLNNLGEVKKHAGDIVEARLTYETGLAMAEENKLTRYYGSIIQNIGELHLREGSLDEAEKCFQESFSSFQEDPETINLAELYLNFGRLYVQKNEPARARDYYDSALKTLEGVRNNFYQLDILIEIYKLEYPDKPESAIDYLTHAQKLAIEARAELKLSKIELLLNQHYEARRNYERALYHFKRYHNLIQKLDANNLILKLKILNLEKSAHGELTASAEHKVNALTSILDSEIQNEREKIKLLEKQNEELSHQAMHDKLTKLPNRRKIDSELIRISRNVNRGSEKTSIGLFMIDIDHFKRVNDSMGHLFGDVCLEKIGFALQEMAKRYNAFVGRYGGEEFIFIKIGLQLYEANQIGSELNACVRDLDMFYNIDNEERRITISVGGLYCSALSAFRKTELVDLADQALYTAKAEGRDCAILKMYEQLETVMLTDNITN